MAVSINGPSSEQVVVAQTLDTRTEKEKIVLRKSSVSAPDVVSHTTSEQNVEASAQQLGKSPMIITEDF